ncbi:hypothetical protein [Haloferax sp. YSSS75]|uniref:hypothetical protein n=1 Tax=Haloferax sp. YSSS75 TaxID=3388564 RepID=UPI00398D27B3
MGHQDRGDRKKTHTGTPRAVEEGRESVEADYVSRILQYEWADVIVSIPPETADIVWVPGHIGNRWGRIAPDVWSPIRQRGYDPYFKHYPTHDRFEDGDFQFELWFDAIEPSGGSQDAESVRERLRERIREHASEMQDTGSWETADVIDDDSEVLWRTTYTFPSDDNVAYYNTLRRAIEDHEWAVEFVHEVVDDTDW